MSTEKIAEALHRLAAAQERANKLSEKRDVAMSRMADASTKLQEAQATMFEEQRAAARLAASLLGVPSGKPEPVIEPPAWAKKILEENLPPDPPATGG